MTAMEIYANERWYVVQCIARREPYAQQNLSNQSFRTFLPFFMKTIRHARKHRIVRQALFPGYLFVALDLDRDRWRSVNGTFGVSRIIMNDERPMPVPYGVVETLISYLDERGVIRLDKGLEIGEKVSVISGPFAQSIGELVSLDEKGRVRILLSIMGGKVITTMDRENLEKIKR